MDLGLIDKVVIVSGSSRGLGFATARLFALEGAKVIINGRDADRINMVAKELSAESGRNVIGIATDVSNFEGCSKLIEAAHTHFGGLDILVTNAGGPPAGTIESLTDETWEKAYGLTLMSNVWLIRAALPHLRTSSCASVVTITSLSVKQPIKNLLISNTLRAGVLGLTKTLALELGEEGIRFNSILPGWTQTERVTELMAARAATNGTSIEDEIRIQAAESPFKRMATPDEFASATVFIASPRAAYITGVNLSVDGGMIKSTF